MLFFISFELSTFEFQRPKYTRQKPTLYSISYTLTMSLIYYRAATVNAILTACGVKKCDDQLTAKVTSLINELVLRETASITAERNEAITMANEALDLVAEQKH